MHRLIWAVLLLGIGGWAAEQPQLPKSAPARRLGALLRAYNSGDGEAIREFIASNYSPQALQQRPVAERAPVYLHLYRESGAFQLRKVVESGDQFITVLVEAPKTEEWYRITCTLDLASPHGIVGTLFRLVPAPREARPPRQWSEAEIAAELDRYLDKLARGRMFSGVVVFSRRGEILYQKAVTPPAAKPPYTVETRFALASINKTFTAVAVAQLQNQKRLGFLDPISNYLREFPRERGITIQQLLTHTAGLEPFLEQKAFDAASRAGVKTLDDMARFIASRPAAAPAGEKFIYSNADYMLLEDIVQRLSGEPFPRYLEENILRPAGMTATGGGQSTALDMTRFAAALLSNKLLPPDATKFLMAGKIPMEDPHQMYAYGLVDETEEGVRVVGHAGGGADISDAFEMYPATGYALVVLSRQSDATAERVSNRLREIMISRHAAE